MLNQVFLFDARMYRELTLNFVVAHTAWLVAIDVCRGTLYLFQFPFMVLRPNLHPVFTLYVS